MSLEDNIRMIVEQVLKEMSSSKSKAEDYKQAVEQASKEPASSCDEDAPLSDLAEIDIQKQLLVPNPKNREFYMRMKEATPARIGVWRCGTRPLTETLLRFRADHAIAQDAVMGEVSSDFAERYGMVFTKTKCRDKDEFLTRPDLGRRLDEESLETIRKKCEKGAQVQIIVADGLSSKAVEANVPDLLPALKQGLERLGVKKIGTPIFVKYGRVAVMDVIGEELKPECAVVLIGERPGLGTAESLSAYMGYNPRIGMLESERMVVSNIHRRGGVPPAEAGAHLATLIKKILDAKASGVNLKL
ncbi:MAG: ethanolamine ammonia-lyase subunit EutC [Thermacetogeniaceae bacterium]